MTDVNPMARLREAINSLDPANIAACFTADCRCDIPMHPSRSFEGNAHVETTGRRSWAGHPS
jgi:hypothetical protein